MVFPVCILVVLATSCLAASVPRKDLQIPLLPEICENTPTSRGCWGAYSIDTNYYTNFPNTGRKVEYWLSVEHSMCNQDGYRRDCMTFNGTMPGPPIVASWGDTVVVHVTNNLKTNGSSSSAYHFHVCIGTQERDSSDTELIPHVR